MASASTSKEYKLAIKIAGAVSSSFDSAIGEAGQKIANLGSIAQAAAATAAAAWGALKLGEFISDAVDTYQGFEQSMANTSAIAGATGEQYDALRQAALEMGKATSKTASECADALGYMSLAGWDVNTSIASLEPVLRLSEATGLDLARCSDLVTDSMSALGLEAKDLSGYLDVAAMANNKSNQTAEMLMEAYIAVGGTMKGLRVPFQDTATALGVMANRGIKGSEAGTALNAVMTNLTTVNANQKMSICAEVECHFSAVSIAVYAALIHHFTCRPEARQALIYQLALGLTGENGKYNYSRTVHLCPPFFDITCSAKNYKIASALTDYRTRICDLLRVKKCKQLDASG